MKKIFFFSLLLSFLIYPSYASFQPLTGIDDLNIKDLAISPFYPGLIYVASSNTLYKTSNEGKNFEEIYSFVGQEIQRIFFDLENADVFYAACSEHLYRIDDGRKRLFTAEDEEEILTAAEYKGYLYIGTSGGFYSSSADFLRWQEFDGLNGVSVYWIEPCEDRIYLATSQGVYLLEEGSGLRRTFVVHGEEKEEEATGVVPNMITRDLFNQEKIWLATSEGLFLSEDKGENFRKFFAAGIDSLNILSLAQTPLEKNSLYLSTAQGFFRLNTKTARVKALFEGLYAVRINQVKFSQKGKIYLATDKGAFTNQYFGRENTGKELKKLLCREPSISFVHRHAIDANEVSAEKIRRWRDATMKKAWLPKLKVGIDKGIDEQYHWASTSAENYHLVAQGPDEKDFSWDVTATWDLGDLVWNPSQTSIDTRSRLNTKLRIDILEEVNRVYFERLRLKMQLQKASLSGSELLQKQLRIKELSAILDYYTGGAFLRRLRELNEN